MKRMASRVLLAVSMLLLGADAKELSKPQPTRDEQTLLELTNKERARENLPPLEFNPLLFAAARGHSANMLKQGKMEHVLDGKAPAQRVAATGYDYKRTGENIAETEGVVTLETVMKGWMDSEAHRKNILKPDFAEIGIAIARDEKGMAYYTQVFGTQRKK